MPARLFLSSGDLVADRRFEFARDLQLKGDLVAAADLLLQATELAPGFASAWFTLGQIREQLGEQEAAIAAFCKAREADPEDRHGASLHLVRLGARKASSMPQAYRRARCSISARQDPRPPWSMISIIAVPRCCSRPCWPRATRFASLPSSGARSISAAAPDWRPAPLPGGAIISQASIFRRA